MLRAYEYRFQLWGSPTEAGFPPAPAVIGLASALQVSTDELLGVRPPKVQRIDEDSGTRRMWTRFPTSPTFPSAIKKPS